MFNIGGQGQYFVGFYVANWLGVDFASMSPLPHILLAVGGAMLAGAAWAGIAGVLKATVGAHEVSSKKQKSKLAKRTLIRRRNIKHPS